tara:strand:+ start:3081 stop:6089 length:3009 start_codon:yes stop_codon:yes gene_type:complete
MAYRRLEQVRLIGARPFPLGEAFGGHIYNINVSSSTTSDPATVEMSIINETGLYNIDKSFLSTLLPYSLYIGDVADRQNQIFLKTLFLYEFNVSQSGANRTLTVKFKDGSLILDKIQVLLLNQDASPDNYAGLYKNGVSWRIQKQNFWFLPVECSNECWTTGAPAWGTNAKNPWVSSHPKSYGQALGTRRVDSNGKPSKVPYIQGSDEANVTNVFHLPAGGAIIIGQEEFKNAPCDLAEVTYTWTHLRATINNLLGIKTPNASARPDAASNFNIRKNFTGSLRDVINQWCNLYGYTWKWNFSGDKNGNDSIEFFDLKYPQRPDAIDVVRTKVQSIRERNLGGNNIAITSLNSSASLEGTYNQDHITSYRKPKKTIEKTKAIDKRVFLTPLTLSHLFPADKFEEISGGRTEDELIISSVLAKFNKNLRTLYNFRLIATKTNNFTDLSNIETLGKCLGLNIRQNLSNRQKYDLLNTCFSNIQRQRVQDKYGKHSHLAIGTYNQELEDKWTRWEEEIANFIGQYYFVAKPGPDIDNCGPVEGIQQFYNFKRDWSLRAGGNVEEYDAKNIHELPFLEILRHVDATGEQIKQEVTASQASSLTYNLREYAGSEFFLFSRTPSYGFKDSDLEPVLFNKGGEEVLKDLLPSFSPVEGKASFKLGNLIQDLFPDIYDKLESIEDEAKRPSLLFFPTLERMNLYYGINTSLNGAKYNSNNFYQPPVTSPANKFNRYEYLDNTNKQNEEEESECKLLCDLDVFQDICECPEGDTFKPELVGLTNVYTRWFEISVIHREKVEYTITYRGGSSTKTEVKLTRKPHYFILPSEAPFSAYLHMDEELRYTQDGIIQHLGALTHGGNAMSYRVNVHEVPSQLDYMEKQDGQTRPSNEGAGSFNPLLVFPNNQEIGKDPDEPPLHNSNTITLQEYHNIISNMTQVDNLAPNESLSFEMVGQNFTALFPYLDISWGLQNFNVSYDENGMRISFNYSSRPPTPISQEALIRQVNGAIRAF